MTRQRFYTCAEDEQATTEGIKLQKARRPVFRPFLKRISKNVERESMIKVRCDYKKTESKLSKIIGGSLNKAEDTKDRKRKRNNEKGVLKEKGDLISDEFMKDKEESKKETENSHPEDMENQSELENKEMESPRKVESNREGGKRKKNEEKIATKKKNERSPLKKKLKRDNTKDNIQNNSVNIEDRSEDLAGSTNNPKRESYAAIIKICIDCNYKYKSQRSQLGNACALCNYGGHRCIPENKGKQSKGYIWICKECQEYIKSRHIMTMLKKHIDEIRTKGIKRKRIESEQEEMGPNEENIKVTESMYNNHKKNEPKHITKSKRSTEQKIHLKNYNITIDEADMNSVKDNNWIHDNIINLWIKHLQLSEHYDNEKLLFVPPTTTQMLKSVDYKVLNETMNSLEAWWKDFIFLTVNDNTNNKVGGNHWSLLIYSRQNETWYHVDSSAGLNQKHARNLARKINTYMDDSKQPNIIEVECTQQINSNDCGVHTMLNMQIAARKTLEDEEMSTFIIKDNEVEKLREFMFNLILFNKSNDTKKTNNRNRPYPKDTNEKKEDKVKSNMTNLSKEENAIQELLRLYESGKLGQEPNQQKQEICRYWAKNECWKKDSCPYKHPVKCHEMIRNGKCNKMENNQCRYYHPKICWNNMNGEICRRGKRCPYRHIYSYMNNDRYESYRRHDNQFGKQNTMEADFLWRNLYPEEKAQIIQIWNRRNAQLPLQRNW